MSKIPHKTDKYGRVKEYKESVEEFLARGGEIISVPIRIGGEDSKQNRRLFAEMHLGKGRKIRNG